MDESELRSAQAAPVPLSNSSSDLAFQIPVVLSYPIVSLLQITFR
jgi:hypothetical protein